MENKNVCDVFLDNYEALKGYAFKICKRMEMAEDIVQEVFLSMYTKYKENDDEIKNKLAFLYQAIRFTTYGELKKNNEKCLLEEEDVSVDPLRNDFLLEELIGKAIEEIPPQRRRVFYLRRIRHLKVKEIAEVMNIKPKTVENHITLVMKSLKERILEIS